MFVLKFLSYLRILILIPAIVVWTAVWSIFTSVSLFVLKGETVLWILCRVWADPLLWLSGVDLEVRGQENMPADRGGLCVFNHTSHYDIMVMFAGLPRVLYFGAKAELFSVPFFGRAMKRLGVLRIERNNRSKVIQTYRDAEARVARGELFALAPEGTRQKGRGQLGEFKSGPFFFAVNARMPIIPIVMAGCEVVLPKHSLLPNWGRWSTKVILQILPPIMPESESEEEVPRLKEKTRQAMAGALASLWANYPN